MLAKLVSAAYRRAHDAGRSRPAITWTWADRHVTKAVRHLRRGWTIEETVRRLDHRVVETDPLFARLRHIVAEIAAHEERASR